jgi:hypothetical protein
MMFFGMLYRLLGEDFVSLDSDDQATFEQMHISRGLNTLIQVF